MDRLRDDKGDSAARLLAQVPRTEVSSVSKARVWAKLRRKEGVGRASFVVRFAVVAVLLCGSFAFAADRLSLLGSLSPSRLFGAGEHGADGEVAPAPSVPRSSFPPAPRAVDSVLPVPSPSAALPAPDAPDVQPAAPSARPSSPVRVAVAAPSITPSVAALSVPSAAAPSAPPKVDEETDLVLDGLRALRREHDPARARSLFSRYLSRHPGGPLAEDALGYSMEAADAQGAPVEAARLAAAYLHAYPSGRYGALAERLRILPNP